MLNRSFILLFVFLVEKKRHIYDWKELVRYSLRKKLFNEAKNFLMINMFSELQTNI